MSSGSINRKRGEKKDRLFGRNQTDPLDDRLDVILYSLFEKGGPSMTQAKAALIAYMEEREVKLLDEVLKFAEIHITKQEVVTAHDNIPAQSTLAMVPVPFIQQLRAELTKRRQG